MIFSWKPSPTKTNKPIKTSSNSYSIYDHDNYRSQVHELLNQNHIISTFLSQTFYLITHKWWTYIFGKDFMLAFWKKVSKIIFQKPNTKRFTFRKARILLCPWKVRILTGSKKQGNVLRWFSPYRKVISKKAEAWAYNTARALDQLSCGWSIQAFMWRACTI